jgi:transposase
MRFLAVFVNRLELKALGFTQATPNQPGRPSYQPGDMLQLYLYGY